MKANVPSHEEMQRIDAVLSRFYFELLTEVDRRARECGAEDITDECGIAQFTWIVAGAAVYPTDVYFAEAEQKIHQHFPSVKQNLAEIMAVFGNHIEDDHAEYAPLFRQAVAIPHVQALGEQLQAFAKQYGFSFDPVTDINRG